MIKAVAISEVFEPVAQAVVNTVLKNHAFRAYFDVGTYDDIRRNLTEKDGNPSHPGKYPLLWLVTPVKEYDVIGRSDVSAIVDLRFIIAKDTLQDYYHMDRVNKVFKPFLYPIFNELVSQIGKIGSPFFMIGKGMPAKREYQLPRSEETGKHLLYDAVDIIDTTFSRVHVKNKIC